jgi:hypothetical protein
VTLNVHTAFVLFILIQVTSIILVIHLNKCESKVTIPFKIIISLLEVHPKRITRQILKNVYTRILLYTTIKRENTNTNQEIMRYPVLSRVELNCPPQTHVLKVGSPAWSFWEEVEPLGGWA